MENTEKVIQIEESKEVDLLETAIFEYKIPDITLRALSIFKEAESLECIDTESRKIIGRHRADIKSLRPKINRVRIDKNKEFEEKNNAVAALIESALDNSYAVFDKKIKAYDAISEKKRQAKAKAEADRIGKIQWHMDGLLVDCESLGYNTPSEKISGEIRFLESIEISAVDFQEAMGDAEFVLDKAIKDASIALENRKKFEEEQAETAKIKAEQKAEAKRLADEKAKFEADRKAQEESAEKKAREAAEKRRQEEEKIQREREALEKEKADLDARKKSEAERKYLSDWYDAIEINRVIVPDSAKAEHKQYKADLQAEMDQARAEAKARWEATEKAKVEAAKRAAKVEPDKLMIQEIANDLDEWISNIVIGPMNTYKALNLVSDLLSGIKSEIHKFEKAGEELT